MNAYGRNVAQVFAGQTERPAVKRNGEQQSEGNIRYRWIHLVLAVAVRHGWAISHQPIENCFREELAVTERRRIVEIGCALNDGPSWRIEDFEEISAHVVLDYGV